MSETDAKAQALAKAIDGKVVDDSGRVAVSVKSEILGFPVTIEAIKPFFPFATDFYVNIDVLHEATNNPAVLQFQITPKVTKGIWNRLGRLLLIDARVRPIGDKEFDNLFNVNTNDFSGALRFVRYPGMLDKIQELQDISGFNELDVRATAGLKLVNPTNFDSLNLDVARETVRIMGEMGQILFDVFK